MRQVALVLPVVLAGCQFNATGLPPGLGPADGAAVDRGAVSADLVVPGDGPVADGVAPPSDSKPPPPPADSQPPPPPPDTGPVAVPLSKAALGQAFWAASVPCVDAAGKPQGYNVKIVDSASVSFFNGAVTLAGAPAVTKAWVGAAPAVTVLYNLNACGDEYPGDSDWGSAGLLIRKATLDAGGNLVLGQGVTVQDIDLVDIVSSGAFEGSSDFAGADDAQLPQLLPQLVNPVGKAKQLIVQLGYK